MMKHQKPHLSPSVWYKTACGMKISCLKHLGIGRMEEETLVTYPYSAFSPSWTHEK